MNLHNSGSPSRCQRVSNGDHIDLVVVSIEPDAHFVLFLCVLACEIACAFFPGLSALPVVGNFYDAAAAEDLQSALYWSCPAAPARVGGTSLSLNGCAIAP